MEDRLFVVRRERGLSQKNVADILRISKAAYQNKEFGKSFFALPEAIVLAQYFNMSLDALFRPGFKAEDETSFSHFNKKQHASPEEMVEMGKLILKSLMLEVVEEEGQKGKEH